MVLYSKTEIRPLISKDLPRRKFDRWIQKIQSLTPYQFERGIPSKPKIFKDGVPQKVVVFDDIDLEKLQNLYDRVTYDNENLTYCIHLLFLSDEDFERWKSGKYDVEEEKGNTNKNQGEACLLGVTDYARSCVPKAEAWDVGFVRSTKWVVGR